MSAFGVAALGVCGGPLAQVARSNGPLQRPPLTDPSNGPLQRTLRAAAQVAREAAAWRGAAPSNGPLQRTLRAAAQVAREAAAWQGAAPGPMEQWAARGRHFPVAVLATNRPDSLRDALASLLAARGASAADVTVFQVKAPCRWRAAPSFCFFVSSFVYFNAGGLAQHRVPCGANCPLRALQPQPPPHPLPFFSSPLAAGRVKFQLPSFHPTGRPR